LVVARAVAADLLQYLQRLLLSRQQQCKFLLALPRE